MLSIAEQAVRRSSYVNHENASRAQTKARCNLLIDFWGAARAGITLPSLHGIIVDFSCDLNGEDGSTGTIIDCFGDTDSAQTIEEVTGTDCDDEFRGGAANDDFDDGKKFDIVAAGSIGETEDISFSQKLLRNSELAPLEFAGIAKQVVLSIDRALSLGDKNLSNAIGNYFDQRERELLKRLDPSTAAPTPIRHRRPVVAARSTATEALTPSGVGPASPISCTS